MPSPSGQWVMKYSMGLAICYAPFFFIGHLFALLTDWPADGFSLPYQMSIYVGCIFYTLLGLYLLRRLLLHFFADKIVVLLLIVLTLGTNYFFHNLFHGQNAMSHNILFTLYTAILLLTVKWHSTHQLGHMLLLGICCGLIILSRPTEIICLLIPLLWTVKDKTSFKSKWKILIRYKLQLGLFSFLILLIGSFQLIYWKIFSGHFIYNSYGGNAGEGFEFLNPHVLDLLFSYRKGWLLYTPIMIFSLIGLLILYRWNRAVFYPILAFTVLNIYICSSWSCWWYAESFGQRVLIQSYAVLILPLGYFIQYIVESKKIRPIFFVLCIFLISLNLFQTWQVERGIIDGSRMTKSYYWSVFGKTQIAEKTKDQLLVNRIFRGREEFDDQGNFKRHLVQMIPFENPKNKKITDAQAFSGNSSYFLQGPETTSTIIETTFAEITDHYFAWIRGSAMVYPTRKIEDETVHFIITFEHNGYYYKQAKFDLSKEQLQSDQWNEVSFDYLTPEVRSTKDKLKVYIEQIGNEKLFIDNLKVEAFQPK